MAEQGEGQSFSRSVVHDTRPPVRVLQSYGRPRPTTNPYISMLWRELSRTPGLAPQRFSYRTAVLGRYDVAHFQWPEVLLEARTPLRRAARRALFLAMLLRLVLTRTPVVRTVHNLATHERRTRTDRVLLGLLDRRTTLEIRLNPLTAVRSDASATILHGHYRDWFRSCYATRAVPGRLASFGLIRPYKGTEALIEAFRGVEDENLSLRIGGQPHTAELRTSVTALAAGDPRVEVDLRYLADEDLVELVTQSELVVLPYTSMHNSGALLAALSLDRPVLVPDNELNAALSDEVGPGWVIRYTGSLTADTLLDALASVRSGGRPDRPDLSAREWADAGPAHLEAYRVALGLVGRQRDR